ncbi:hypothetical protein HG537_0E03900 [Torulaspora globosa]|uniref:Low temperature viability protein n=1 Tax=Torulaspora globosa TaxID=48254 RepID=A0A7H9HX27_9SACH|nr:hypothetical protein HG537_0E03900 [Torulaspora sp. CBS 2947]
MSKKFSKKNAQKYVVVHRPHDDPHYYDSNATEHVLVPVGSKASLKEGKSVVEGLEKRNEHLGEAALYGISFDDSKYDYTQHLKPIGRDPENSFFIPAKTSETKKKSLDDLLVEPRYGDEQQAGKGNGSVFQRGIAKPEYLLHQQEVPEEISGFRPDLNPALREVLEALEDEAYVINDDIVVKQEGLNDQEDDIFAELLESGQAEDEEAFADEWDVDNLEDYEEEQYHEELAKFTNVENLEDLKNLDYQADVRRFQKERKQANYTDDEFEDEDHSVSPELEEQDALGDLPSFAKTAGKKRKERRKKGAMSDVSGFSMTSSAIARTETMTVLDDKYDQIISGYENYQDEQLQDEQDYQPFDMSKERPDFESMLDDFLDNYELESGGRKLVRKDDEIDKLKRAADEVSKGKLSQRRNRERNNKTVNKITNTLSGLKL